MIEHYEFGSIIINGKTYTNDVIFHGNEMLNENWWREEGHSIAVDDLKDLPDKFDVLVVGKGANGVCNVPAGTIQFIENKGIDVVVQKTDEAVKTYNRLSSEGKDVVGAFHLTC